jgi:hypothetical protein
MYGAVPPLPKYAKYDWHGAQLLKAQGQLYFLPGAFSLGVK